MNETEFRGILYHLEEFLNEELFPSYKSSKQIKNHFLLIFSQGKYSPNKFEQQEFAPVMMHAISEKFAKDNKQIQAISVIAFGQDEDQKLLEVILYLPIATYSRTYILQNDEFTEEGEKWFELNQTVYGFQNPFYQYDEAMIKEIPALDFRLAYASISEKLNRDTKNVTEE